VLRARSTRTRLPGRDCCALARSWLVNLQNVRRAEEVAVQHYDLGNDLFRAMLDRA
jgi:hypothetical protein